MNEPKATAYVLRTCGACSQFLRMVASSPKLIRDVEIKIIDGNPQALIEMHDLGANKTPTMVVYQPNGQKRVYQGTQAMNALVGLA